MVSSFATMTFKALSILNMTWQFTVYLTPQHRILSKLELVVGCYKDFTVLATDSVQAKLHPKY